jgi:hypothetical protein
MSQDFTEQINVLSESIGKILLMVVDSNKINTAAELMKNYSIDFHNKIKDEKTAEGMEAAFKPHVNTVMSICETLGIPPSQWKPTRKLILNEMYKFKNEILLKSVNK